MVKITEVKVQGKTRLIGVAEAARALNVSRQFIHGVYHGRPGYKSARVERWLRDNLRRAS